MRNISIIFYSGSSTASINAFLFIIPFVRLNGRSVGLDQAIPLHLEQRLAFIALKNGNY